MNGCSTELDNGFEVSLSSRDTQTSIMPEHRHGYYELYFLRQGTARNFVENDIIPMQHGDFVFIKAGAIHQAVYEAGCFSERLLIDFTGEFVGSDYFHVLQELGERKYFPASGNDQAIKLAAAIHNEYTQPGSMHRELCCALLQQLLILLYRQNRHQAIPVLTTSHATMQNAAKYIGEHYSEDLSLSILADMYALSKSHFSRSFKNATGFGLSKYINLIRVRNAEQLLADGNYPIAEVATKCGFNDSNYFSAVFKSQTGVSPQKYMAQHQKLKK